jgi:hypothetical protein
MYICVGLKTRAIAVIWNPLNETIPAAEITLPLYYAGLSTKSKTAAAAATRANVLVRAGKAGQQVAVREQEGAPALKTLSVNDTVVVHADLKPMGITYFVVEEESEVGS